LNIIDAQTTWFMKSVFTIVILLFSMIALAQQEHGKDVVFPVKGKAIKNCCVINIGPGNMISYIQQSDTLSVLAKAYIKEGELIDVIKNEGSVGAEYVLESEVKFDPKQSFEENRDYYYHENLYKKHRKNSLISVPFLAGGLATLVGGTVWYYHEKLDLDPDGIPNEYAPAILIMVIGSSSILVGSVILFDNLSKAQQHQEEMQKARNQKLSLGLGLGQNGIGFILKF